MTHPVRPKGITPAAALASVLALALAGGLTASAAQAVELTFGVGLRAEAESNPDLTPAGGDASSSLGLNLSFGLVSETAASVLTVSGTTGLVAASGSGNSGLTGPTLTLSYLQETARADFTLDASLTSTDLDGALDVDDFEVGSGSRRTASLNTGLVWGKTGPLGLGLNAGITDVSYYDNPTPDLIASQTVKLAGNLRADLSPVLSFGLSLSNSRFTQPGEAARDTLALDAGLTLARPAGQMALHVITSDTPDGDRDTLRLDQTAELAAGTLSWSLGATRGVTGTTRAIGSLTYAQDLAQGAVTLGLNRTVAASALTDAETLQSSASLTYNRPVTPRATLALALNWAEQTDTGTDLSLANTSLAATWTQSLAQDWALDLGVTHRLRDQDGVGQGQSDSVFLEFRRDFSLRY